MRGSLAVAVTIDREAYLFVVSSKMLDLTFVTVFLAEWPVIHSNFEFGAREWAVKLVVIRLIVSCSSLHRLDSSNYE